MGFVKLAGLVLVVAAAASYATFVATRDYYLTNGQPADLGSDSSAPLAITPAYSVEKFPAPAPIAVTKSEEGEVKNNSPLPSSQPEQRIGDIERVVKQREAQQQQINNFREFVATEHKRPLIEEAGVRYETEPVNYQWAATQEDKLLSTFTGTSALQSFIPSHMSCRSATCKVTIPAQDDNSAAVAYQAVLQAFANQQVNQSVTYFSDPAKGEVVMYISPEGQTFFQ
jgi:hypothetical protein